MKEVGVRLKVGATGLENIQALSKELEGAGVSTTALDAKAAELAAALKRLGAEQGLIDSFKKQKQAVADAAAAMEAAKAKAAELGREIGATEAPTRKQEAAFTKARTAARDASDAYTAQRVKLQDLRGSMAAAGVSTESLAAAQLGVKARLAEAQAGLAATAEWAQRMAAAERGAATEAGALGGASTKAAQALRQQGAAAQQSGDQLKGVEDQLRRVASVGVAGILGSQTVQMLKGVAETADAFANLQARVRLVTGEGPAFTAAMAGIAEVALRTHSNLETTGQLFTKLAQAGKEMGLGQQQALALTETINQAVQLSGASASASDAAITQLVQGLQSGVLRGDEFNSVMEQAPRLAQALASGLGVTTGELRKLAEAGELSASTVVRALQSQSTALQKEFGSLPATVGRAVENLNTKWQLFIGSLNGSTGATGAVANGINGLADNLGTLAGIAERAGAVLLAALAVQGVGALRALAVQMVATGGAAALLSKNLADIPKVINIAVAVVGFEVGYQIGKVLYENSELARKLGIGITQFFVGLVDGLRLVKDAAAAIFTDDTIGAAFDRFKARIEDQRRIFQGLYDDAANSPEVVRAAAVAAAAEAKALGDTATDAGAKVAAAGATGAAGLAGTTAAAGGAAAGVQGVGAAAAGAKEALAGLAEAAKTASRDNTILGTTAAAQAEALVKVALSGRKAADVLRTELPEAIAKLSGAELEQFRVAMTQALANAETGARRLAAELGNTGDKAQAALARADQASRTLQLVLQAVGAQAAQSLGVDLAAASTRVTDGFKAAEQQLATLISTLPALKAAGVDTGAVVGQALAKMIDGAKNQVEVDGVIDRVNSLGKAGVISAGQVAGAFDKAKDKVKALKEAAEDANPGIQSIGEAARKAGVEVELLTTGMRKGFADSVQPVRDLITEVVKAGVSAEKASPVLADALNKQLEAAKTKEEVALVRAEIERAGAAGKLFGNDFSQALDVATKKAEALSPVMRQLQAEAKRLGVELAGITGSKPSASLTNPDGSQKGNNAPAVGIDASGAAAFNASADAAAAQRAATRQGAPVDASYQFDVRRRLLSGGGFNADEAAALANGLRSAQENQRLGLRSTVPDLSAQRDDAMWVSIFTRALDAANARAVETAAATSAPANLGIPSTAVPVSGFSTPATVAPASSGTRTVNINIAGLASAAVNVASDADASRLEALLQSLAAAAGRTA